MWTRFMDMHSGGRSKEKWNCIYIEAPENEAKIIFYNRFGHNPERVTCTCCGEDYSIRSDDSLEKLTEYDRNHGKLSLKAYKKLDTVCIIPDNKILKPERIGVVPDQGYIWKD